MSIIYRWYYFNTIFVANSVSVLIITQRNSEFENIADIIPINTNNSRLNLVIMPFNGNNHISKGVINF